MDSTNENTSTAEEIKLEPLESSQFIPAGFWVRFAATFIDGCIVTLAVYPLVMLIAFILPNTLIAQIKSGSVTTSFNAIYYLIWLLFSFFYIGWFYANKGGTPGKLLFNLKVISAETGTYLSYPRAFFREILGKYITNLSFMLLLGFLIFFRSDKRMLHDLIFDTRVIRKKQ